MDELDASKTPKPFRVISGQTFSAKPEIDPAAASLVDDNGDLIATLNRDHPNFEANIRIVKGVKMDGDEAKPISDWAAEKANAIRDKADGLSPLWNAVEEAAGVYDEMIEPYNESKQTQRIRDMLGLALDMIDDEQAIVNEDIASYERGTPCPGCGATLKDAREDCECYVDRNCPNYINDEEFKTLEYLRESIRATGVRTIATEFQRIEAGTLVHIRYTNDDNPDDGDHVASYKIDDDGDFTDLN